MNIPVGVTVPIKGGERPKVVHLAEMVGDNYAASRCGSLWGCSKMQVVVEEVTCKSCLRLAARDVI